MTCACCGVMQQASVHIEDVTFNVAVAQSEHLALKELSSITDFATLCTFRAQNGCGTGAKQKLNQGLDVLVVQNAH